MSNYDRQEKQRRFEQFEQRLVMSAQAITNIAPQLHDIDIEIEQQVQISPLDGAHSLTGVDQVHQQYGFDGSGQTVAIIDSGIAWDHYALGGGYGANARVVGGWDFAENDANPYDDGPAGFHGTHVAGIVGSSDATYQGVASGVDLVGLRVFDDSGVGNLEWVEQALQWVHEHKDDFENPITTVNLSIGTDWNSDSVPNWANLEEEFAQLEADGLFISVAAGNSFQDYNSTGLSYPAVSPFVVPVASHDADGNMSDFSQRDSNVLVAPGEHITSTVPDHLFGGTSTNRFIGTTGTSMAAPYVAGASSLLRQANEFMGTDNIDQDLLYQQFVDTANQVFDSVTGGYYYNLNVEAAIDAVINDRHSGSWLLATDAGTLVDGSVISGTIGKASDVDTFAFTADQTGQITLNFETTHDLFAFATVQGQDVQIQNNRITFSVVAGQEYKFQVGAESGRGHYEITVSQDVSPSVNAVNWGATAAKVFEGQHVAGQQWYQLTAANGGFLSIVAQADTVGQNFELAIYDAQMNELAVDATTTGQIRLDVLATSGETFYVKAVTDDANVDFQVNNLVSIRSGKVFVNGTAADDVVNISTDNALLIDVNGMAYQFDLNNVDHVGVAGNGGNDTISTSLDDLDDLVTMRVGSVYAVNENIEIYAAGFENIHVNAGAGTDVLAMFDSQGNDVYENNADFVSLSGNGFENTAIGFSRVSVRASSGYDSAVLNGSAGQDTFVTRNNFHVLRGDGNVHVTQNFDHVVVDGKGGNDTAHVFGSSGQDQFTVMPNYVSVVNDQYVVSANDFGRINAISESGDDSISMLDSYGDDHFVQNGDNTIIKNGSYLNYARGFTHISATARGGYDTAQLYDTAQNDTLFASGDQVTLSSAGKTTIATGFDRVNAVANNGGYDQAEMIGSVGTDFVFANINSVNLTDDQGMVRRAVGFNTIDVDTGQGQDFAFFRGSSSNEVLTAGDEYVEFETVLQELRMSNVDDTRFEGNGGVDEVIFNDFDELDLLTAIGDKATAYLNNHKIMAEDFAFLDAATEQGHSSAYDIGAVDYLFMLRGNWQSQ